MNRSSLYPWLCNECKDHNDHPSSSDDWHEIANCSTNDSGEHHSFNDKPSLVFKNKTTVWHKNGLMHRDNGMMAMECFCVHCTKSWVWAENGKIHRISGPAIIQQAAPWTEIYSLRGISFNSKEEHKEKLNCSLCKRIEQNGRTVYCTVNDKGNHHSFDDNPSQIISSDSYMTRTVSSYWHKDEKIHRLGGPAYQFKINGKIQTEEHWINNGMISKAKYLVAQQTYQRKITMNQLQTTISQSLKYTNSLQSAVEAIVLACCTIGAPFYSEEIARHIRAEKPNIVFAVPQVGRFLRDMYINFHMEYNVDGVRFQACRADRYNDTGDLVYVYGPTQYTAENHDFKVDIPGPQTNNTSNLGSLGNNQLFVSAPYAYGPISSAPTPTKHQKVIPRMPLAASLVPPLSSTSHTLLKERAKVHSRERLAIPSTALEKLRSKGFGGWLQPGSTVSFVVHNGILKIVAGYRAGWEQKAIQANKGSCGRLYFTAGNLYCNLTHKDSKTIKFDEQEKELRITL